MTTITQISKFYLLDATSPNTGTMPTFSPASVINSVGVDGDATGATTARDATDVAGSSNPDIESQVTATANTSAQTWGHRRFVSRPLAAHTFATGDGNWTWSYARSESSLNHNAFLGVIIYVWRPSDGSFVNPGGTDANNRMVMNGTENTTAATEQAESKTGTWGAGSSTAILDGDILVFDIRVSFTQGMASAYTDQFAYNGTTEASTTSCASFVTPPAALTLYAAAATGIPDVAMGLTVT